MESTVQCRGCGSHIVPRLWSRGGSPTRYARVSHCCPICGTCIHVSGGRLTLWGRIVYPAALGGAAALLTGQFEAVLPLAFLGGVIGLLAWPAMFGLGMLYGLLRRSRNK